MRSLLFIFVIHLCSGYQVKDGPLLNYRPSWLKKCSRTDSKMNDCLNDLFAEMFPQLAKGIAELNIDAFEPLYLDKVSVTKGTGAVTLTGSFTNLTVIGPSNSTPTYTDLDIAKKKLNFGIFLPLLDIKSHYNLKGHILILPLVGNGRCELILRGVDTKVKAEISMPLVHGKEVIKVESMKVGFTIRKVKVKLDNLFNGNKVLGLTVNTFLNQNGNEIVTELEESIAESLAVIFKDIINNIFTKIPTELYLPKDEDVSSNIKRDTKETDVSKNSEETKESS